MVLAVDIGADAAALGTPDEAVDRGDDDFDDEDEDNDLAEVDLGDDVEEEEEDLAGIVVAALPESESPLSLLPLVASFSASCCSI